MLTLRDHAARLLLVTLLYSLYYVPGSLVAAAARVWAGLPDVRTAGGEPREGPLPHGGHRQLARAALGEEAAADERRLGRAARLETREGPEVGARALA